MTTEIRQEDTGRLYSRGLDCGEKDSSSDEREQVQSSKPRAFSDLQALHTRYILPAIPYRVSLFIQVHEIATQVIRQRASSCYSYENKIVEVCSKALDRGIATCWHFNCYGFINHCIREISDKSYDELVKHMYALRDTVKPSFDGIPCPYNLATIFEKGSGLEHWRHIQNVEEAEQGDIIVYLPIDYQPLRAAYAEEKPTGTHVVVVAKNKGKTAEGFSHFNVIDCTRKFHSTKDSRFPDRDGIGKTSLFIFPEAEGKYRLKWKEEGEQEYKKKIVIGRMERPLSLRKSFTRIC